MSKLGIRGVAPLVCLTASATLLDGCSACDSRSSSRAVPKASVSAAPLPPPTAAPEEVAVRRSLAEREPLDAAKLLEKRADVLDALNRARDLLDNDDARAALSLLGPSAERDPLGGAVALALARAALAAGEPANAAKAARLALLSGEGRPDVAGAAGGLLGQALEKLGRPREALEAFRLSLAADPRRVASKKAIERLEKAGSDAGAVSVTPPVGSVEDACKAIERDVRSGKVELLFSSGADVKAVDCAVDGVLDVEAPTLRRAHALRVEVTGGHAERLVWVAVESNAGLALHGPVARAAGTDVAGVVNDVIVDLQKIDVLSGGAPEIVVKTIGRRTLPDVALDEVLEVDETRALLLSVDRGGVVPSREVVLSSRRIRTRIDPKAKGMPRGVVSSDGLGKVSEFSMKVAWGRPNTMTLTVASGNAKPPLEGEITLFP